MHDSFHSSRFEAKRKENISHVRLYLRIFVFARFRELSPCVGCRSSFTLSVHMTHESHARQCPFADVALLWCHCQVFLYRLNRRQGDVRSFNAHHVRKNCMSHLHDDNVGCYISVQFSVCIDVRNEYTLPAPCFHLYMQT